MVGSFGFGPSRASTSHRLPEGTYSLKEAADIFYAIMKDAREKGNTREKWLLNFLFLASFIFINRVEDSRFVPRVGGRRPVVSLPSSV